MKKILLKNLFQTFILSLLLTAFLYIIWYNMEQRGLEGGQALRLLMVVGGFFWNCVLLVFTLPVFYLADHENFEDAGRRRFYYFGGPILATIIFLFLGVGNNMADVLGLLLPSLSFLSIHFSFYRRLIKQKNSS